MLRWLRWAGGGGPAAAPAPRRCRGRARFNQRRRRPRYRRAAGTSPARPCSWSGAAWGLSPTAAAAATAAVADPRGDSEDPKRPLSPKSHLAAGSLISLVFSSLRKYASYMPYRQVAHGQAA